MVSFIEKKKNINIFGVYVYKDYIIIVHHHKLQKINDQERVLNFKSKFNSYSVPVGYILI